VTSPSGCFNRQLQAKFPKRGDFHENVAQFTRTSSHWRQFDFYRGTGEKSLFRL